MAVLASMITTMLSPSIGTVNAIIKAIGHEPIYFLGEPSYFRTIYIISGIWQNTGWNSIVYLSSLTTIDESLYEAAIIDGANRFQRIWHITLPGIQGTIMIMLVLNIGNLMNVGFDKVFLLQNPLNISTSEVIRTYVYKQGIKNVLVPEDYVYLRQVIDGNIYHIPHILDFPPSFTMLIRKDWVDKLGMNMPETWEEWKAVWKRFKEEDVNGDGDPKNEIPLMCKDTADLLNYVTAFGIKNNNELFCTTDDDQIIAIFDHPNFKNYLTEMVDLYSNGILDREFATRSADYKAMMDNDLAGSTLYYAERAKLTTDILRETNPKAAFYPVPPIKSKDGKQLMRSRTKLGTTGGVFTINTQKNGKAKAIMQFYNYVYSKEGSELLNYGLEGKHHDIVDEKPVINAEITKGGFNEARKVGIVPSITPFNFLKDAYLQILLGGQPIDNLPDSTQYFYNGLMLNEPYFYSQIPIFSTTTYVEKQAPIKEKLMEIFANTITGRLTVEQFYKEYEKVKESGFEQIIIEQQEAYIKVKK